MEPRLPLALTRHLADAEIAVVSWSAFGDLVLRVVKEIGPEVGRLRFTGVGVVHLPPQLTIAGITAAALPDGDTRFEFAEAWGAVYSVVASAAIYTADAESGA